MKNRLLEVVNFTIGALILPPIATAIISVIEVNSINIIDKTWLLYIASYILYPIIVPKEYRLNKVKNILYFSLLYFFICFACLPLLILI